MKKWFFLFILITIFGLSIKSASFFEDQDQSFYQKDSRKHASSISIHISKEQIYHGPLLLVNEQYPVHKDSIQSDIIPLNQRPGLTEGFGLNGNIHLSEDVAHRFSKMVLAARKDGVNHFVINSGYRDFDEQASLFKEMGSNYALPPGYSEHNLGLSIDVGSSLMKMEQAPEGQWINNNAWKYGFILRYPQNKTAITGIEYEPWHIRYVGLPHSAIMYEKGFTLEEYLDYVRKEKKITTTIDGENYTITYYPALQENTVTIPNQLRFELSGNNVDGVIMTIHN